MSIKLKLAIAILLCFLLPSCRNKPSTAPSQAFTTFDMSSIIIKAGFQPKGFSESGTTNAATGLAKHIRSGTFTAPINSFPCYAVFRQITDHFTISHQVEVAQEGWNPKTEEHPTKPFCIAMKYKQNRRYGELRLWLFPSEDYTSIDFALYFQEEPLR
jgi:hypothetical protein